MPFLEFGGFLRLGQELVMVDVVGGGFSCCRLGRLSGREVDLQDLRRSWRGNNVKVVWRAVLRESGFICLALAYLAEVTVGFLPLH